MNGQQTEAEAAPAPLDEADVAGWLRQHPDFFQRHRELAVDLRVPHDVGPAISLVALQTNALGEKRRGLRTRLDDLLQVARDNDRLADQLHRLTLELLEARDLNGIAAALCDGLRNEFEAEQVRLGLITDAPAGGGVFVLAANQREHLGELFPGRRPTMGRLTAEQRAFAFGDLGEGIRSPAVMPIEDGPVRGLLAVGSACAERYHTDHGTIFLGRLGELVGRVLRCSGRDEGA